MNTETQNNSLGRIRSSDPAVDKFLRFCSERERQARGSKSSPRALAQYMTKKGYEATADELRRVLDSLAYAGVGKWDAQRSRFIWNTSMIALGAHWKAQKGQAQSGERKEERRAPLPEPAATPAPMAIVEPARITIVAPDFKAEIQASSEQVQKIINILLSEGKGYV